MTAALFGVSEGLATALMVSAVLDYAARGWRVLPLDGKVPLMDDWPRAASSDPAVIRAWWARWPCANVGVLCDGAFGFAVDVDDLSILDFLPSFPPTLTAETPGGGLHLVYRHPSSGPVGNSVTGLRVIARSRGWRPSATAGGKERGIDVRGLAGQIVVAPSVSVDNGLPWRWLDASTPAADAPEWLLTALTKDVPAEMPDEALDAEARPPGPLEERDARLIAGKLAGASEGGRGTAAFTAGADLGRLRFSRAAVLSLLLPACRTNGLVEKDGETSVSREIANGWREGLTEIAALGARQSPPEEAGLPKVVPDGVGLETDLANMHRMVATACEDSRFVPGWGKWVAYEVGRWVLGGPGVGLEAAKLTTFRIRAEADELFARGNPAAPERFKWALKSQSRDRLAAMEQLSRSDPRVRADHPSFDADPWLLNVANGTVDLRDGSLRPHARDDLLAKVSPVAFDPRARCPAWESFVLEIMGGDVGMASYLRRLIGYAATGDTREQVLSFFYGGGANGKTTFLSAVKNVLGDYAVHAARGLLFQRRGETHPTELTDLFRARFVTCAEIEEGLVFDEALVKDLTGGETIRARRMREDFWEFSPTHKLFVAGNHKPTVRGTDDGIWRRMRLINFGETFPPERRDKDLSAKLTSEYPGILNWIVRGCLEWRDAGLGEPDGVLKATKDYRADSDLLGDFLASRLVFREGGRTLKSALTVALRTWAEDNGIRIPSVRVVAARLRSKGAQDTTTRVGGSVRDCWGGVDLLTGG